MKTKLSVILVYMLFLFSGIGNLSAQVSIGLDEKSEQYATLQIKDKAIDRTNGPLDDVNATKGGLMLPRVKLTKKKQMLPFATQADVDANTQEYQDAKKLHTGLIVYNLEEDDEEELCFGLSQWDGEQWNCLQNKMGNAIAELGGCDSLQFIGLYQNEVSLGAGNYMTIALHVKKAGAYTITAMPDPDNGYYFTTSGVFLTPGYYFISIGGAGTPLNHTEGKPNGDAMTVTFNNKEIAGPNTTCLKYIDVRDSSKKPIYSMLCNKTRVNGVYQLDKELNDDNYIEVTLDVDAAAVGATYVLETNTIDGIYFKASGMLTNIGEQTVKLKGYGTPNSYDTKVFTITSNSIKTSETCKATVIVSLATKVTYGWGFYANTAGYLMNIVGSTKQGTRKVVDANVNFGTDINSKVKIVKYSATETFSHSILSGASAYNPTNVKAMFDQKPEIILVGFDLDLAAGNRATVAKYMVDYLNEGGVLILNLERATMATAFFEALYPGIGVSTTWLTASRYQIGFMNDEILNGVFGDIRGLYWGNDSLGAISITGLPEEDIVVYSRDPSGRPMMFRHKYYNLFFIGEGGVFANIDGRTGSDPTGATGTTYPVAIDANSVPITRTGWTGGNVENGRLFGNVMAWAVKQAQFNGINTSK